MFTILKTRLIALGKRIGQVQAWLLLTVMYILLLAPVALLFKCVADPLALRKSTRRIWHSKSPPPDRGQWARAQS